MNCPQKGDKLTSPSPAAAPGYLMTSSSCCSTPQERMQQVRRSCSNLSRSMPGIDGMRSPFLVPLYHTVLPATRCYLVNYFLLRERITVSKYSRRPAYGATEARSTLCTRA
ncbi:hypothetical protein RvY_05572-1 [Ramazzottius varieornatus]|uniref:Uncharacterized protein n=1 Tax=Ramazzottius varieornatus TaxID=947166 RepID=A0A1D1UW20_RAMVA|nr:hypothetical protein RvY_05572-1 [Ramazzottius varieornatus]